MKARYKDLEEIKECLEFEFWSAMDCLLSNASMGWRYEILVEKNAKVKDSFKTVFFSLKALYDFTEEELQKLNSIYDDMVKRFDAFLEEVKEEYKKLENSAEEKLDEIIKKVKKEKGFKMYMQKFHEAFKRD